ncbi:MAG: biotin--[acetyl-CoA-carboxylase] ligase [Desulfobulbaceae bacterium]|jgi:BirA family biotin operon repressor/biotin-[acetyl-CoA-carboxylase] ligase|nr:biotin--[acetyl-CoA-carboxylase] ligase [Desulfobulbaceae bacterium]
MPLDAPDDIFIRKTASFLPDLLREETRRRRGDFTDSDCQVILKRGGHIGATLLHYDRLPRAMAAARRRIIAAEREGQASDGGLVIVADQLSESKGRFHRLWHAPEGGLWGCLALANTMLPESRALLSLAVGVAAAETARVFAADVALRWVNDVLARGRKLAGFLIESFSTPIYREEFDLIGFAFNLNNQDFPADLRENATSLAYETGQEISLPYFLAVFLVKLRWNCGLLLHEEERLLAAEPCQTRHSLLAAWLSLTDTIGRRLRYGFDVFSNPQYEATATGIDERGGLILEHQDGWRRVEYSGEVRYLETPIPC